MVNTEKIESNLNDILDVLKQNMEESFEYIDENPKDSNEMINIWKEFANEFMKEFITLSEKYNNRDIVKAIGKMIMFGR
ncbi:MAG: hypothetical protein MJA82_10865 [Clostridia bacterium]|nr:hypothetical protein [Clostridia bacterium]